MLQTITLRTPGCDCYFEYEDDLARPYLARWVLCGLPGCEKTKGYFDRVGLDVEIELARTRLQSLEARRDALGRPTQIFRKDA